MQKVLWKINRGSIHKENHKIMIRKISFLLALILCINIGKAQQVKPIKAKLSKATVYLQGAHLYYTEQVLLKAGYNEYIFENISPQINTSSLQANSKGGLVMDVKYQLKYKEAAARTTKYDKEIERVLDSIEDVGFLLKETENKLRVLTTEKQMLLNNKLIKGQSDKDSVALLKDGMQFLREKLNNIYDLELKWERSQTRLHKTKTLLDNRYQVLIQLQSGEGDLEQENAQPVPQVKVVMYSENGGTATLSLNYFVQQANWIPLYDLQASSTQSNLQLKFMAHVTQSTGINWTGVPLTLSTSNPQEGNIKPELNPWYVSFVQQRKAPIVQYMQNSMLAVEQVTSTKAIRTDRKAKANIAPPEQAEDMSMSNYLTVTENLLRTEYEIKLNYNIESDGQPHKVLINQKDVPMQLRFAAVPKICTDAFLLANITNWEDMNIIPGNARVFFDDAFVGDVYLNAMTTSDTLSVNMGRDKSIAITRKKLQDKTKTKLFDNEKVETRTIEIVVRNTKNTSVEMVLEDQVPVPYQSNDIKVNVLQSDQATYDPQTGKLEWKLKLGSKEVKKIMFTYEVRYPKDKIVYGL